MELSGAPPTPPGLPTSDHPQVVHVPLGPACHFLFKPTDLCLSRKAWSSMAVWLACGTSTVQLICPADLVCGGGQPVAAWQGSCPPGQLAT